MALSCTVKGQEKNVHHQMYIKSELYPAFDQGDTGGRIAGKSKLQVLQNISIEGCATYMCINHSAVEFKGAVCKSSNSNH